MFNGIYSSATALNTASISHEIVANNLANVNSAGFRRTLLAVQERPQNQADIAENSDAAIIRGNQISRVVVDFSPGSFRSTGRNLDLAINGEGFFSVEGPQSTLYTRNGFFQVNQDRELVTADGFPVLASGSTIQLPSGFDASQLEIQADGTIRAGENQLGKLDIVDFQDKSLLRPVGTANFLAPPNVETKTADGAVVQGSLELANTQAVSEMIQMIMGSRHFESAQRALRTIADSIEKYTNMDQ